MFAFLAAGSGVEYTAEPPALVVYFMPMPTGMREVTIAAIALLIGFALGRLARRKKNVVTKGVTNEE